MSHTTSIGMLAMRKPHALGTTHSGKAWRDILAMHLKSTLGVIAEKPKDNTPNPRGVY